MAAAEGAGTISSRTSYSLVSGLLPESEVPATLAKTIFFTGDNEKRLLSDGTGTRQQQRAGALKVGIKDKPAAPRRASFDCFNTY